MQLQEALQRRKSVRGYTEQPIGQEQLLEMLRAASLAPSWKNS